MVWHGVLHQRNTRSLTPPLFFVSIVFVNQTMNTESIRRAHEEANAVLPWPSDPSNLCATAPWPNPDAPHYPESELQSVLYLPLSRDMYPTSDYALASSKSAVDTMAAWNDTVGTQSGAVAAGRAVGPLLLDNVQRSRSRNVLCGRLDQQY